MTSFITSHNGQKSGKVEESDWRKIAADSLLPANEVTAGGGSCKSCVVLWTALDVDRLQTEIGVG